LAEHCAVNPKGENRYLVNVGSGTIMIEMDPCLQIELFNGSNDPIYGWVSRGYHIKQACTTLIGRCLCEGNISLTCRINIDELKHYYTRTQD